MRPAPRADEPVERTDANSRLAHQQLLQKAKTGKIDVYFIGDSITRRWGATDPQYASFLENWKKNFFGWNAADFGWGADTTQNILWRLHNGELDGVNPKIIVIMAGTNNVGARPADDAKVDDIARGIKAIVDVCRAKAPTSTIILMGITPRNDNMGAMAAITRINEIIKPLADGKIVRFVNINDKLADKDGKVLDGMLNADKLHLALGGYQVWADALKPIFTEILGAPKTTDVAPPPTGDPSATRPVPATQP
jgi:lysophospholipase L1-like esterase